MVLAAGTHIGRFDVVRHLGDGGLASVYLVQHRALASLHALKLLHGASPDALRRFVQQAQVLTKIRHPNVVAVTDLVELSDQVAVIMEFVEGTTLAEVIADDKPLSRRDVVELFSQICTGVRAAHARGVLHRDLKPANVLLSVHDRGVTAKIADFGIASALAEAGATVGTPGYMAPEHIRGTAAVDVRADVFALGVILYELIANRSPFVRRERRETIAATLGGEHMPLGGRMRGLPPAFVAAVERAIALDPEVRFATVAEFERAVLAVAPALIADSVAEEGVVPPPLPLRTGPMPALRAAPPPSPRVPTLPPPLSRPPPAAIVRPPLTAAPVPSVQMAAGLLPPGRRRPVPAEPVAEQVRVVAPPARRSAADARPPEPEPDTEIVAFPMPEPTVAPVAAPPTLAPQESPVSPPMDAWTTDDAAADVPKRGELWAREEARQRALAESGRSFVKQKKKRPNALIVIIPLLLLVGGGWQTWTLATTGADAAQGARSRLSILTQERTEHWDRDGLTLRSIREGSSDPAALNAAIDAYRLATTPRTRADAGRQVVRAARVEIVQQAAAVPPHNLTDASERLDAWERDLFAWETVIDAEARTREETGTELALSLGFVSPEMPPGVLKVSVLAPILEPPRPAPVEVPVVRRRVKSR